MFKIISSVLLFSIVFACDVQSPNVGEQAMIKSLRAHIDADPFLKKRNIILGAGKSGCKKFKQSKKGIQILLTWQWLEEMEDMESSTIIIIPRHAVDSRFKRIGFKLILTDGVLHTRTLENIAQEDSSKIPENTELIVMLAGDAQQDDGQWSLYSIDSLSTFLKSLPYDKRILFLNGPRTGKHKLEKGLLSIDETAHKTTTDKITKFLLSQIEGRAWTVTDFKFDTPSLFGPALKFCLKNKESRFILPGESTSMISETLTLGIKPAIYVHPAMTKASEKYVESLVKKGKATLYPKLPSVSYQKPLPQQEKLVIQKLKVALQ